MALDNLSEDFDIKFLFYYFQNRGFNDVISGSAQPQITGQGLDKVLVPKPPLSTQHRIAAILDKADALRRKDQAVLKKYDELAQGIFMDMFGDPVRNEMGWEVKKFGMFCEKVSSGSTPLGGSTVYQREGTWFIRSQNVLMNKLQYDNMYCISDKIHNSMKRTWVKKQDILLNITGASIGRVAIYEGENDNANVNQHVCIIRTLKDKLEPYFLSRLIGSHSFQLKSIGSSMGGTRESFNFEQIKAFEIIYPPLDKQKAFVAAIKYSERNIELTNQTLAHSEALFQSLLQQAFQGELV